MVTGLHAFIRALSGVALLLFVGAANALAVESGECLNDWSLASRIVERENLVTVEELSSLMRGRIEGAIVRADLCRGREGYVYRLVVQDKNGGMRTVTVDALNPYFPGPLDGPEPLTRPQQGSMMGH